MKIVHVMRIIDAHNHLINESDYEIKLLQTMDSCGINLCCISGLGDLFYCRVNNDVRMIINEYPDRFIGAYFIRPGKSKISEIGEAYSQGFRMIKVTIPTKPYDDISFHPYWKIAEELQMPILFHTGIATYKKKAWGENINSWNMHPMRIEPIANEFPDLPIIIAHLGVHWNIDAAEIVRMKPNVYVDLTGEPNGWRLRVDKEGFDKYLWWEDAWKKVIFGTDVHFEKIPLILQEDMDRLERYKVPNETQKLIFSSNISKMLGM